MLLVVRPVAAYFAFTTRVEYAYVAHNLTARKLTFLNLVIKQAHSTSETRVFCVNTKQAIIDPASVLDAFYDQVLIGISINLCRNLNLGLLLNGLDQER